MLGAPEVLMTAFMVLFPAIGVYVAYWVIRLGVRHGLQDVQHPVHDPVQHPGPLVGGDSAPEGSRSADADRR